MHSPNALSQQIKRMESEFQHELAALVFQSYSEIMLKMIHLYSTWHSKVWCSTWNCNYNGDKFGRVWIIAIQRVPLAYEWRIWKIKIKLSIQ